MSDGTPEPELTCRHCGASNHPGSSECWLCQRRDWRIARLPTEDRPLGRTRGPLSTIAGHMLLIALIAVFRSSSWHGAASGHRLARFCLAGLGDHRIKAAVAVAGASRCPASSEPCRSSF